MEGKPKSMMRSVMASVLAMTGALPVFSLRSDPEYRRRFRKRSMWKGPRKSGVTYSNAATYVRNPKIAAQMNAMHDRIEFARLVRQSA